MVSKDAPEVISQPGPQGGLVPAANLASRLVPGLVRCARCGLPETYETIEFDEHGVCNICRQKEFKDGRIDWDERKGQLDALIADARGKYEYDCILPFSGGKDSTFTLHYLVKEYGIKPLVIQFNHGFMRPNLKANNERTFRQLGVEVLSFTPNWKVVKRVMLEALIRKGDFCWHCHTGIFAYPMHVALKYNTPLIFWGEPSSEYTAYYDYREDQVEEVDETRFNRYINLGITAEDMEGMIKGDFALDPRDLKPFTYPPVRELRRAKVKSVCLGSFIPWDVKRNTKLIQDELGWKGDEVEGMPDGVYPYEKIECWMQGVRDYIKWLKRGYSRVTQMTALDLRNGRIEKAEAERLIAENEGKKPPSLALFLEYLGISEDEFNAIVLKTVVPPHKPDFANIPEGKRTWDYDQWYREARLRGPPGPVMIGILDIDLGNLRSVSNAVDSLGYDCKLVLGSESWDDLTHLIVPGVGSYHVASQRLDERALRPTVRAFADSGRPVLGICLGMQLLSTTGEENGEGRGFDLVPGHVKKLDPGLVPIIPHTGWNSVELARKHPVFEKVKSGVDFYFVHSYHFEPRDAEDRLGETVSGQRFVSIVGRRNVLGFQFHPEKSQANGLRLLEGFCDWSGKW